MNRRLYILSVLSGFLLSVSFQGQAQFARLPQQDVGQQSSPTYGYQYPEANGQPLPSDSAQEYIADEQHGVARISILQGDVNIRRGDNLEFVAAAVNAPLLAQDRLQTSTGSRAEIEYDSTNAIRLSSNTDVGLANVQYRRFHVQIGAGTVLYRVLRSGDFQGEIDTPNIALRALNIGAYRVSVLESGVTRIDVRAGTAEIFGLRSSETIEAGHSVLIRGNPADPEVQEVVPSARDQFDDWNEQRDSEVLSSQSYRYVGPDVSGAEDLDANGTWVSSEYGQVWAPRNVGADWSPYSYGQWAWVPYYGWSWVDYAPWGWAPYHYGRWFVNGGHGWCWWPGPTLSVHHWNPALVAFFGLGNGSLGWAALAPQETFHPWWGHGRNYGAYRGYGPNSFDRSRSVAVWNAYRNTVFRGGVVYTSYNLFGGLHQRFGFATREQMTNAKLLRGQLPVMPSQSSYWYTNKQAVPNPRLAAVPNRQFFRNKDVPIGRDGNYMSPSARSAIRSGESGSAAGSGWQRFGYPGSGNGYKQGLANNSESGWHQFGKPQAIQPETAFRQSYPYGQSGTYGGAHLPRNHPTTSLSSQPRSPSGYTGSWGGRSFRSSPYGGSNAPHMSSPISPRGSASGSRSTHGRDGQAR